MEPVSVPAARGTLEDPEVLQNVPGHIIPILQREYDDFKTEATKFLDGQTEEDEFIKFRLKQGVYGQRQPDVQMIRVKLPFGGVTPEQMEAFADVVEKYVPLRKGHITTRQNIQMHHVPLPGSREADPRARRVWALQPRGLRQHDAQRDRRPLGRRRGGRAVRPHPLRRRIRALLRAPPDHARACPARSRPPSTAAPPTARSRRSTTSRSAPVSGRSTAREVRGVEMLVGGGTSIMPRIAQVLYDFLELDNGEYLKITEAVMRIFDRQEWLRVNRARARIKVFVDKYGIEELRKQVEEELKGDWVAERDFSIEHRLFLDDEREAAPAAPPSYGSPNGDSSEFERFRAANVRPQKQEGFVTVEVKVTRGDLTPEQFRGLAAIMRAYAGGYARTTVQQNFVLRWVREECVYDLWRALSALGLGGAGAREVNDVVSCPGTDSCKLGITSSMGLNEAVQERIEQMQLEDELTRQIHIKISGCPNGCGQHHVGSIGFTGASIKVGDHTIPAYIPLRRRSLRRRRRPVRDAPEAAPPLKARTGRDRALDTPL